MGGTTWPQDSCLTLAEVAGTWLTPPLPAGIQLIKHGAWRTRDRGGQFVLLGSAPDPKVQAEFDSLAGQMSGDGNAAFCFSFDEPLSHLIYAACDIILVPSIFEPCGLTQVHLTCVYEALRCSHPAFIAIMPLILIV